MKEIVITPAEAHQRVDKYVRKLLPEAPLSFIYKLFRKKDVKINGHWVDIATYVAAGDVLRVYVTDAQLAEFMHQKPIEDLHFDHDVLYEDDHVLIVDKPRGLLVHGDEGETRVTLANEVLSYLYQKKAYDPQAVGFTPAPAHRLDRNTSGLVAFGKDMVSLQALEDLFKEKKAVTKEYWALAVGPIEEAGKIDLPLIKDAASGLVRVGAIAQGASSALTLYRPLERLGPYTLISVTLVTGRTHQIRVHMQAIGHPLVGDGKYGSFAENRSFRTAFRYEGQFLHAARLTFGTLEGPLAGLSGKTITAPWPEKEAKILAELKTRYHPSDDGKQV